MLPIKVMRPFAFAAALNMTAVPAIPAVTTLALLAGCSSLTPSTLQSDAQLIATGLGPILADLTSAGVNVPADIAAKINNELSIINAQAAQIGSLAGSNTAAQDIVTAVGVLSAVATPFFPAAPLVAAAIQAAVILAQGLVSNGSQAAATPYGKMTPDQARMVLRASAAGK